MKRPHEMIHPIFLMPFSTSAVEKGAGKKSGNSIFSNLSSPKPGRLQTEAIDSRKGKTEDKKAIRKSNRRIFLI
ncbi:hypothetical protein [Dialister succinatiphilus]|uniref:hypothetical protein n=1 Tax=Dialister succinatiphilus TaxID=487173 RepID=UPI002352F659|nr:hypothetical protein [Dialister succinatiphilus]